MTQEALLNIRPRYVGKIVDESHAWVQASFVGVLISGALLVVMLMVQVRRAHAAVEANARAQIQLRDAVESISEGFALYDADDRLVLCNTQSRGFQAGIEDKLIPGTTFEEISQAAAERGLYGDDVAIEEVVEARMALHRNPSGPLEQQGMDGRWLLVNEQRTSDGGTVVVRTDVTHLKKVEEDLIAAEEKFRNLVEGSIEGIVIHRDFEILFANEAWAKMHGYTVEKALQLRSLNGMFCTTRNRSTDGYQRRPNARRGPTIAIPVSCTAEGRFVHLAGKYLARGELGRCASHSKYRSRRL